MGISPCFFTFAQAHTTYCLSYQVGNAKISSCSPQAQLLRCPAGCYNANYKLKVEKCVMGVLFPLLCPEDLPYPSKVLAFWEGASYLVVLHPRATKCPDLPGNFVEVYRTRTLSVLQVLHESDRVISSLLACGAMSSVGFLVEMVVPQNQAPHAFPTM